MNLREKKVLTTAERNQLVSQLGPLSITTEEATNTMPKITYLTDKEGLRTSHFMAQDLFEWQFGHEIEQLPADEWVPVGPSYTLSYRNAHGVIPESHTFRLTQGKYVLTENDLPVLESSNYIFDGWTDGKVKVEVGSVITGSTTLTAVWKEKEFTISYSSEFGIVPESKVVTAVNGEYELTVADLPENQAEGKIFGGWTLNGEVAVVGNFIEADAELVAMWSDAHYSVEVIAEGEGVEFAADKSEYVMAETAVIIATVTEGYEVESVSATWTEGEVEVVAGEEPNTYTFAMPAGDVTFVGVGKSVTVEPAAE